MVESRLESLYFLVGASSRMMELKTDDAFYTQPTELRMT